MLTSLSSIGIKAADVANASASGRQQEGGEEEASSSGAGHSPEPSDSLAADADITLRTLEREVRARSGSHVPSVADRPAPHCPSGHAASDDMLSHTAGPVGHTCRSPSCPQERVPRPQPQARRPMRLSRCMRAGLR